MYLAPPSDKQHESRGFSSSGFLNHFGQLRINTKECLVWKLYQVKSCPRSTDPFSSIVSIIKFNPRKKRCWDCRFSMVSEERRENQTPWQIITNIPSCFSVVGMVSFGRRGGRGVQVGDLRFITVWCLGAVRGWPWPRKVLTSTGRPWLAWIISGQVEWDNWWVDRIGGLARMWDWATGAADRQQTRRSPNGQCLEQHQLKLKLVLLVARTS